MLCLPKITFLLPRRNRPAGANSLWQAAQNAASVMAQRGHANAISPPPDSTNNPTVRPRPRPRPRLVEPHTFPIPLFMPFYRFSDNDEVMEDVEPPRRSTRTTSQKGPSADPDELYAIVSSGVDFKTELYLEFSCILPPVQGP